MQYALLMRANKPETAVQSVAPRGLSVIAYLMQKGCRGSSVGRAVVNVDLAS